MTTTTPPLRAQVLALRRTQSARDEAKAVLRSETCSNSDVQMVVCGVAETRCLSDALL